VILEHVRGFDHMVIDRDEDEIIDVHGCSCEPVA
jgi:hypothetical protein